MGIHIQIMQRKRRITGGIKRRKRKEAYFSNLNSELRLLPWRKLKHLRDRSFKRNKFANLNFTVLLNSNAVTLIFEKVFQSISIIVKSFVK